jgi:uncharacterized integral membrane protein (TIGR00698 family)
MLDSLRAKSPGVALAAAIALTAWVLQQIETRLIGYAVIEGVVLAILLGMLVRNTIGVDKRFSAGVLFVAKDVLEFAVMLLGASVSLPALFGQGLSLLLAIVILVVVALTVSAVGGRALGLNPKLATLVAVGNAICGNSAIAAVAPVIKADSKDVASAIAFTAVLGVIVVLSLPLAIPILGYTHFQYGVLAGMSVYAVPQVVAAAAQVSDLSQRVATTVKLVRVLLLGPVVLYFSLRAGRGTASEPNTPSVARSGIGKLVPWFIAGFMLLAALRSIGVIPEAFGRGLSDIGKYLTIGAMAALGLGVDVGALRKAGPRVVAAVLLSLAVLLTCSVILISAFGLNGGDA